MTIFPHSMMGTYTVHFGNRLAVVRKDAGACGETSIKGSSPSESSTGMGTIWPVIIVQNPFFVFFERLRFRWIFAGDCDGCGFSTAPRSFLRTECFDLHQDNMVSDFLECHLNTNRKEEGFLVIFRSRHQATVHFRQ